MVGLNITVPGIEVREASFEEYVAVQLASTLDCMAEVFGFPNAAETIRDFESGVEVAYLDPASFADALFA